MSAQGPGVWTLLTEILTILFGLYLELGTAQIFTSRQFQSLQGPISHVSQQNNIIPQSGRSSSVTIFVGSNDQQSPRTLAFQEQPNAGHRTRSLSNGRDESANTGRWLDRSVLLTSLNSFQPQMSAVSQQSMNNLVRGNSFPVPNNFQSHQTTVGQQKVLSPVRRSSSVVANNIQLNHGVVGQEVNIDSRSNSLASSHVQSQRAHSGQQSNFNRLPSTTNFHTSDPRNSLSARATRFQNGNHPLRITNNAMQTSLPRQHIAGSKISQHVPNIITANKAVQQSQLLIAPHSQQLWPHSVGQHLSHQNIHGNNQNLRSHTEETSNRLVSPIIHASNTAGMDTRLLIQQNTGTIGKLGPSEHTKVISRNETFRSPGRNIAIASNDGSLRNTVITRRVPNNLHSNAVHVPTIHIIPQLARVSDLNNGAGLSSPVRLAQTFTVGMNIDQSGTQNIQGGVNGQLLNIDKEIQRPTQWVESSNPLSIQRESAFGEPNFANRNDPFPITNGISVIDQHASGLSLDKVSLQLSHRIQPTATVSSIVKDLSGNLFQTGGVPIKIFENSAVSSWQSTSGGMIWQGLPFMGESPDSPDVPDLPSNENENEIENQQSKTTSTKVPPIKSSLDKNEQQIRELQKKPSTSAPSFRKERIITLWTPMPLISKMLDDLVQAPFMHTQQHVTPGLDNKVNVSRLILSDLNKRVIPLQADSSNEEIKTISEKNALTGRQLDKTLIPTPNAFSNLTASHQSSILQDTQQVTDVQKFQKRATAIPLSSINSGVGQLSMNNFLGMKESRHSDNSGAITQSKARVFTNHGSKDARIPIAEQQSPNFEAVNKNYLQVSGQANMEVQSRLNSQQIHSVQNTENKSVGSLPNETINMNIDPISKITTQVRTMIDRLSQLIHQNTNISPNKDEATHNTISPFTNKNTKKMVEPTIIGVDQKITGNISGNGSDHQTCVPFANQFYCIGKDMFANVPGVADWCVQKCRNDSCLLSVCDCSCSASTHYANNSEINKNISNSNKVFSHSSKTSAHTMEKGQLIHVNPKNANVSYNRENQNNTVSRYSKGTSSSNVAENVTFITWVNPKQKIVKRPLARRLKPLLNRKQGLRQKQISIISTTEEPHEVEAEEIEIEDLQTTTVKTTKEFHTSTAHYNTTVQDYFTDAYYDYTTTPGYETFGTTSVFHIGFRETLQTSSSTNVDYSTAETNILLSQNSAVIGERSPGNGILTDPPRNNTNFIHDTSRSLSPQQLVSKDETVRTQFNEKGQGPIANGKKSSYTHLQNDSRGGENFNTRKLNKNSTGQDGNNVHGVNLRGKGRQFDRTTPSMQTWDRGTDRWRSRQTTLSWSNNRNRWNSRRSVTTSSWTKGKVNDRQTRSPPWNRDDSIWGAGTTTPTWQGQDTWQHGTGDIPPLDNTSPFSNWRNRPLQDFNSWNGRSDRSAMRRSQGRSFSVDGRNEVQDQWSNTGSDRVLRDSQSSWSRGQIPAGWRNDWRFSPSNDGRRNNNGRNLRDRWNRRTTTPPSGEGGEETKGTEGADKK
ncbi:hypothetical protein CHS0354_003469 [Potamilus streckersoni]|uniref:Uncharacterized protein n=1 Tax=Potamilus streckersoni TaxID=2493646 RepID=A0AAE0SP55_9BIVA|nr:hypothetical protein CHS0354_003469 [Potamilus streckersoni]